ncbi:MAG: hypothetical protein IPL40_12455 [Proteobacteria bacterium]|nr:hypothetical protein [Pseudomonadota bacterium]
MRDRRWRRLALLLFLLPAAPVPMARAGARAPAAEAVGSGASRDEACAATAERWTASQSLAWLGQQVREMRANALHSLSWRGQRLLLTLHHERLALMEALLAAPQQVRAPDARWGAARVSAPFIELVAARPLPALDEAAVDVLVSDEGGRRYRVPYHTRRAVAGGFSYRLPLVGPLAVPEVGPLQPASLFRVMLELRPRSDGRGDAPTGDAPTGDAADQRSSLRAQWALAPRALAALDRAPALASWARLRLLRLVQAQLLRGDREGANAMLSRSLGCDQSPEVIALRRAVAATLSRVRREAIGPPDRLAAAATPLGRLGRAWALRLLVARELLPAVQRRLLSAEAYRSLQDLLREVASALQPRPAPAAPTALLGRASETAAAALQRFDARLAEALIAAFAAAPPQPSAQAEPALIALLPRGPVDRALGRLARVEAGRRVALAQLGLRPWRRAAVASAAAPMDVEDAALEEQVSEQELLLHGPAAPGAATSERLTAVARRGVGAGWVHAGLPVQPTEVSHVDQAARYWRQQASGAATLEALRAVARRLLMRGLLVRGPSGAEAELVRRIQLALAAPTTSPILAQAPVPAESAPVPADNAPVPADNAPVPADNAPAPRPAAREGETLRQALDTRAELAPRRAAALALAARARPGDRLQVALERLASEADPLLRGAAVIGLAQRGKPAALLALGVLAREGPCELQAPALITLGPRLDAASRRQLLLAVLPGRCEAATREAWQAVLRWHADDLELLRAGLSQRFARARIEAALSVLPVGAAVSGPEGAAPE